MNRLKLTLLLLIVVIASSADRDSAYVRRIEKYPYLRIWRPEGNIGSPNWRTHFYMNATGNLRFDFKCPMFVSFYTGWFCDRECSRLNDVLDTVCNNNGVISHEKMFDMCCPERLDWHLGKSSSDMPN